MLRSGVRLQALREVTLQAMMVMQETWWFAAIMITRHGPDAAREAAKFAKEAIDARDNHSAMALAQHRPSCSAAPGRAATE